MKIFWAWQSDLPGNVSRHFVRDALLAAIKKLKEAPDIEEPDEGARRNEMHLDSDRQGLSGSPDLARAILEKISCSSVFIGDVTPVGKGPAMVVDDGTTRDGKPLMNPNVAIELGYALARLTDARVLMILNTAYGNRDGLPFDIKHKGGPILYHLAEGASTQEIASEKSKLVSKLSEAIGAFKPVEPTFQASAFKETEPKIGKAFYFGDSEVLGKNRDGRMRFAMTFRSVFYLRVIPTQPLVRPLPLDILRAQGLQYGVFGYDRGDDPYIRENDYGVIVFDPASTVTNIDDLTLIDSLTQYFRNGEIWGINAYACQRGNDDHESLVSSENIEFITIQSLKRYLDFFNDVSEIKPPYTVEAGLHGVKGKNLVISGAPLRNAKIFEDRFELRRVLHSTDRATQDKFLLEFFEQMHDQTGHPRPQKLYGFPPDRTAAQM
jgi:hypothetical protein